MTIKTKQALQKIYGPVDIANLIWEYVVGNDAMTKDAIAHGAMEFIDLVQWRTLQNIVDHINDYDIQCKVLRGSPSVVLGISRWHRDSMKKLIAKFFPILLELKLIKPEYFLHITCDITPTQLELLLYRDSNYYSNENINNIIIRYGNDDNIIDVLISKFGIERIWCIACSIADKDLINYIATYNDPLLSKYVLIIGLRVYAHRLWTSLAVPVPYEFQNEQIDEYADSLMLPRIDWKLLLAKTCRLKIESIMAMCTTRIDEEIKCVSCGKNHDDVKIDLCAHCTKDKLWSTYQQIESPVLDMRMARKITKEGKSYCEECNNFLHYDVDKHTYYCRCDYMSDPGKIFDVFNQGFSYEDDMIKKRMGLDDDYNIIEPM